MAQHSKDKKDTDLETITGQLLVPSENLSLPLLKGEAQEAPPPQCPPLSANDAVLTGLKMLCWHISCGLIVHRQCHLLCFIIR